MKSIKKSIIKFCKRIVHRDNAVSVESLKEIGVSIGEDVHIYGAHIFIDKNFPWMLSIGDHVHITNGCHILCHDYSWIVGKNLYHNVLGGVGKVSIGNNVFIGTGAIILMNTEIGNNVIVGAGSVVSGKIPSNCVVAGSPAKKIMTLEDYWNRRQQRQYEEAANIVIEYYKKYGSIPPKEKLRAYFFLFESRENFNNVFFKQILGLGGNYDQSYECFRNSRPMFESYESFVDSISDLKKK